MPAKIFISYRRDDVPGDARGVRDGLVAKFGKSNVFMDVDNLLVGQRFDIELAKALDDCDILIAVVGPRWLEILKSRDESERDYVREEIAEALKRKIAVVPVRVGREGNMPPLPRAHDLPADIRELFLYQKHDVAHERFGRDIAELTTALLALRKATSSVKRAPKFSGVPWPWIGATAVVFGAIAFAAAYILGVPMTGTASMRGDTRVAALQKDAASTPQPKDAGSAGEQASTLASIENSSNIGARTDVESKPSQGQPAAAINAPGALPKLLDGISVSYYQRERDEGLVNRILSKEKLKFSILEGRPEQNRFKTNALLIGRQVPLESSKALALALVRGGVRLQAIEIASFKNPKQILILTMLNVDTDPPSLIADPVLREADISGMTVVPEYRR